MREFNLGKLVRFLIIGFVLMMFLRACTYSTVGGYGPGGQYYGSSGFGGGGGGGFFTGMLLGNMLGGGSMFGGGRYDRDRNVRRGSMGSGYGKSRSGGFGFGK